MPKLIKNSEIHYPLLNTFCGEDQKPKEPRQTPDAFYCIAEPDRTPNPTLLACSEGMCSSLDLNYPLTAEDLGLLAGNADQSKLRPYATCYGGHQFGNWAGQLGDGRAINLGALQSAQSHLIELQTKGSGLTAYSRSADGKAVLRSSVREYIMSEAMAYLGVPTTRALCIFSTGEKVRRDMFYDGNIKLESGAIVCRTAESFLRFGHFEILASRGKKKEINALTDFIINQYFPGLESRSEDRQFQLFKTIFDKTLDLIVAWQRVGFTHGVLNTDNMSLLGLTIDYGPFGMLDQFKLDYTPNTTDLPGRRYAFGQQPFIGLWNLERLAVALLQAGGDQEPYLELLKSYNSMFYNKFSVMKAQKLGLSESGQANILDIIKATSEVMEKCAADYTLFFRAITAIRDIPYKQDKEQLNRLLQSFYREGTEIVDDIKAYLMLYRKVIGEVSWQDPDALKTMKANNPVFIPRNHHLFAASEKLDDGDHTAFELLLKSLTTPYAEGHPEHLISKAPAWAFATPGCSTLSCSS